ncbi:MAG: hypothetical protein A2275_05230 [Bacteroidetes bacterium RIFOXYA12_FULL_35_11]|nr:MAG: hypothetical protein A2X01_12150 [Bacteroidetes bacterium GWF2_35_48]OFY82600.1 MAG: hypothetical protein A2275_05230 [Bacteroidetes bacterium RIFOXYA12_FULL_35_11]OFY96542.1 MAG: hypothetical protein A2309_14435 [Bacteroidetes bacterium RIFOXYB2_FULL_35_7]OFZ05122.1 MAG: hypothetical protein A2491_07430 [Bacteroidetes bacterium RIFOXYC12_FULL_35_7]HBX49482.1 hypothetical protein [Bacteroidales bacterium]
MEIGTSTTLSNRESEVGSQKTEVGSWKTEVRRQKTEELKLENKVTPGFVLRASHFRPIKNI